MSKSVDVADAEADEVGLEARDESLLAEDQRHPVGLPPSNGSPSRVPDEGDDGVVAVLGAAVLDRARVAFWSRSSSTTWSMRASSMTSISGPKLKCW